MKIDNLNMEDLMRIESTYDNLDLLKVIKYFVGVIINDIEYMNDLEDEEEYYDLGNNYVISNEDFESVVSILETIQNILDDNKYEYEIENVKNKDEMKKLVNKLYKDEKINDNYFSDLIYNNVIPKLNRLGVKIETYNEELEESGFETILKENY